MTIKQHKSTNNNFEFQSLSNFCGLNVFFYGQVPPFLGNSGCSMDDTLAGFSIEIYIYKRKAALTLNIKHYCMLSICQLQVPYKFNPDFAWTCSREIIESFDGSRHLFTILLKNLHLFKIAESVINLCLRSFLA